MVTVDSVLTDRDRRVLGATIRQHDELERLDESRDVWRWLRRYLCALAGRELR